MFLELCIKVGKNSQVIAWCVFMNARTILDFFYITKGLEKSLAFKICVFLALLRLNFKVPKTWNKTRLLLSSNFLPKRADFEARFQVPKTEKRQLRNKYLCTLEPF